MSLPFPIPTFSLLLPDLRSGWNVGALFRTGDACGVNHLFLTGHTPYPPHKEIRKTALGAEEMISWSYHLDAKMVLRELKESGVEIVALEIAPEATLLEDFLPKFPLCVLLGNELSGVPADILEYAEKTVMIPMRGGKESLNVAVAGSIALWEISRKRVY